VAGRAPRAAARPRRPLRSQPSGIHAAAGTRPGGGRSANGAADARVRAACRGGRRRGLRRLRLRHRGLQFGQRPAARVQPSAAVSGGDRPGLLRRWCHRKHQDSAVTGGGQVAARGRARHPRGAVRLPGRRIPARGVVHPRARGRYGPGAAADRRGSGRRERAVPGGRGAGAERRAVGGGGAGRSGVRARYRDECVLAQRGARPVARPAAAGRDPGVAEPVDDLAAAVRGARCRGSPGRRGDRPPGGRVAGPLHRRRRDGRRRRTHPRGGGDVRGRPGGLRPDVGGRLHRVAGRGAGLGGAAGRFVRRVRALVRRRARARVAARATAAGGVVVAG